MNEREAGGPYVIDGPSCVFFSYYVEAPPKKTNPTEYSRGAVPKAIVVASRNNTEGTFERQKDEKWSTDGCKLRSESASIKLHDSSSLVSMEEQRIRHPRERDFRRRGE